MKEGGKEDVRKEDGGKREGRSVGQRRRRRERWKKRVKVWRGEGKVGEVKK